MKERMSLADLALGLQGISRLRDPVADNIRQYLYYQLLTIDPEDLGIIPRESGKPAATETTPPAAVAATGAAATGASSTELTSSSIKKDEDKSKKTGPLIMTTPGKSPEDINALVVNIIDAVRGLRMNYLQVPRWLAIEYNAIEERHADSPVLSQSRSDKLVLQRYKLLHPTDNLVANTLLDGFRMDLCFPGTKLNVELDSPRHRFPAAIRFDRARDAYVEAKGYEVLRLQLTGRSVDDLVSQIHDRVTALEERQKDREIQSIYAADAATLYTPQAAKKVYNPRKNAK
jgi:very-short-patch-repair endonuclease